MRASHVRRVLLAVLVLFALVAPGLATSRGAAESKGEPKPGALTMAMERVIIFKDGYGLFVKSGTGTTDREGRLITTEVPEAVLGTLWASVDDHELLSMTAAWADETDETVVDGDCASTQELLRANVGKLVSLHLEKSDITGRLVKLLEGPSPTVTATPAARGSMFSAVEGAPPPSSGALLVVDDTPNGRLVFPAANVLTVSGKDLGIECKRKTSTTQHGKKLTFDLGMKAADKAVKLHMFYFAPGVRWIPTYHVDTGGGAKAGVELQAEVLNEAEDLRNVAVDLVVGVPNFRFKDTTSPLSLESTLRQTLAQAAPQLMSQSLRMGNNFSNAAHYAVADEVDNSVAAVPAAPSVMTLAPNMTGEGRQDLFTYAARSLTLPKGARAIVPLWSTHAAQRHLYTADMTVLRGAGGNGMRGFSWSAAKPEGVVSPMNVQLNNVWHQLELSNTGDQPWTTGAALLTQGYLPLAQELLTYTSPGAKALVPITVAVDLRANVEEKETSRTQNALTLENRHYTLVKKKGTVTLVNHRKEASSMHVSLSMGGTIDSASNDGRTATDEARAEDWGGWVDPRAANHDTVTWDLTVGANDKRVLTYTVSFYE